MLSRLRYTFPIFAFIVAAAAVAQTAASNGTSTATPPAAPLPSAILQPALSDVQSTTSGLNISRWKAPNEVRAAAQQDVDSIQRDLGGTLPGLISQADSAPGSVPPSFAVYRNIDALYEVLLRVSETADLAAPPGEDASVASCLRKLEAARAQLAESILQASQRNEAQIVAMQAAARAPKPVPQTTTTPTVVDDGPAAPAKKTTKKKAPAKKPTPSPTGTPAPAPATPSN